MADRLPHPRVDRRWTRIFQKDVAIGAVVLISNRNSFLALENLEWIWQVGGPRHARQFALDFGIGVQPIFKVLFFLRCRRWQVGDLAALHHTWPTRLGPPSAARDYCSGSSLMTLEVPIRGIHTLPNAIQVGLAASQTR